jgi:hypothetical protein
MLSKILVTAPVVLAPAPLNLLTAPVILAGLVKAVGLVVIHIVALVEAQGVALADPDSAVLFSQENPLISLVMLGIFTIQLQCEQILVVCKA